MEQLFVRNESENNEIVLKMFSGMAIFAFLIWLLHLCGIFTLDIKAVTWVVGVCIFFLMMPVVLVYVFHLRTPWMKYLLIAVLSLLMGVCYCVWTFQMVILLLCPSLVAMLYMNKRLLLYSGVVNLIVTTGAHIITGYYVQQPWLEPFIGLDKIVRFALIPRLLQLGLCFAILVVLMNRMLAYMQQMEKINGERQMRDALDGQLQNPDKREYEECLGKLTDREKEIFIQMLLGKTNMQIADRLCLSVGTVKNYVSSIYDKVGTRERNYLILKFGRLAANYD